MNRGFLDFERLYRFHEAGSFLVTQQNGSEYLYEALDFVARGKVKTIVETYPLAEAAKAYERVAEGKARFRAVLTM
jgi:D-arabinose 1-dehydrogenase-like Zn-dependent alcohol dehydrogenase